MTPSHSFGLIVQHAVAKAFKIRVGNLLLEFLAHAFIFFGTRKAARTVTARTRKSFFDHFDNFPIGIECDLHVDSPKNAFTCSKYFLPAITPRS